MGKGAVMREWRSRGDLRYLPHPLSGFLVTASKVENLRLSGDAKDPDNDHNILWLISPCFKKIFCLRFRYQASHAGISQEPVVSSIARGARLGKDTGLGNVSGESQDTSSSVNRADTE
jgi:hypothetical protein